MYQIKSSKQVLAAVPDKDLALDSAQSRSLREQKPIQVYQGPRLIALFDKGIKLFGYTPRLRRGVAGWSFTTVARRQPLLNAFYGSNSRYEVAKSWRTVLVLS